MLSAISSALKGLLIQKERVNTAAENIANFPVNVQKAEDLYNTPNVDPASFEGLDLSLDKEIVDMMDAVNLYKANAAVIRTQNELLDELLDIKA